MSIQFHNLNHAGLLRPGLRRDDRLHLIRVNGRATQVEVPDDWRSLWMPLAGTMQVMSQDTQWKLSSRDYLLWEDGALHNCSRQRSWFLVLCGPPVAWQRYLESQQGMGTDRSYIFPTHTSCPREVRRLLVHLTRRAGRADTIPDSTDYLVAACCSAIADSQGEVREYLARCSGRSEKHRRHKLLRLLRVRHVIANCADGQFDLQYLSGIANYSPWHLTRTYSEVFGETPSEHATRLKLTRAMELVSGSALTIREITEALGFESQSTFCRSFKKAYGKTTTQARSSCGVWDLGSGQVESLACA